MSPEPHSKVRDWEGQILRLNNNIISTSVRPLRGKQRIPVAIFCVITPVLNVLVGRQVLCPLSILMFSRRSEGRTPALPDLVSPFFRVTAPRTAFRIAAESGIPRCIPATPDRNCPVVLSGRELEPWREIQLCRQLWRCGRHRCKCD